MRLMNYVGWSFFGLALLLLGASTFVALGPGHRYRTPLVDLDGHLDRDAVNVADDYKKKRALDDVEILLINQERHLAAQNQ